MFTALSILDFLLNIAAWIIIINVILSLLISFNVINTHNDFVRTVWNGLERLCEPVYRPIRRFMVESCRR